mgnify:CR=1 FL=1
MCLPKKGGGWLLHNVSFEVKKGEIFGIYGLAYMVMFWNSPYAGPAVVVLLCAGGACYILGAIVYALRKPDPWPRVFGFHEIFHCGTVAGYACHMVAIYMVIVSLWQ